jgi:hypothetical protein
MEWNYQPGIYEVRTYLVSTFGGTIPMPGTAPVTAPVSLPDDVL